MNVRSVFAAAALAVISVFLSACGSKVKGNTYESFPVSIAFQSGGKASFSSGRDATDCTYTEGAGKVMLTCGPQSMELTIDSDGNLNGPPEGIGKLIKKK